MGPSKEDIETETRQALEDGMKLDTNSCFTYKTTTENEVLQAVGISWVGEKKNEVQSLSDEGSQGSFISHKMARRNKCPRLRVTNLTVRTLTGEHIERTFIYKVKAYNFAKKNGQF